MKVAKRNFRGAEVSEVEISDEDNTVEFSFSSEHPVSRYWGKEILDHSPGAMNLERAQLKAMPFLWNHNSGEPIGMIESASVGKDKRGKTKARFFSTPFAQEKKQQMKEGLRNISFGYELDEVELTKSAEQGSEKEYTVRKFSVFEISMVSIPADPHVGVGRSLENGDDEVEISVIGERSAEEIEPEKTVKQISITEGARKMNEKELAELTAKLQAEGRAQELSRVQTIMGMAEKHGQAELARKLIAENKTVDQATSAFLEATGHRHRPLGNSDGDVGLTQKEVKEFSWLRLFNALGNPKDIRAQDEAGFEFAACEAAKDAYKGTTKGVRMPIEVIRHGFKRDLTVGSAAGGGYTVATELKPANFVDILRKKLILQAAGVQVMDGISGNIAIPKASGSVSGYWVAENGAVTESQATFGQISMQPRTVGGLTDISRKLLIQSSIAVENWVKNDIAQVIARMIDLAGLYGTGSSNQPTGLFATSGINTVDFAAAAPTWDEIVSMETAIASDDADLGNMKYLTNAIGRGALKTTKKDSGSGIFLMENGLVNGYGVEVSNTVKTLSSTDPDFWFGNFADLVLGMWGGPDFIIDPYTGSAAGTVRIVAHQDVDFGVRHAESFCYGNKTIS